MALLAALYEPFRELAERNPNLWLGPPGAPALAAGKTPVCLRDEAPDAVTLNGVPLPHNVVMELRKLGVPLAFYTAGELRDAVNACAVDCTLVDDEDGVSFQDKLVLSDHERAERPRITAFRHFGVAGFTARIDAERGASSFTANI